MIIKGGYFYEYQKKTDRDVVPKGHFLFLLSAGHTKLVSLPYIKTVKGIGYTLEKDIEVME